MMDRLGIANRSNFNKTIRKHDAFREAMVDTEAAEVSSTSGRYKSVLTQVLPLILSLRIA